jgi:hypothetical protein
LQHIDGDKSLHSIPLTSGAFSSLPLNLTLVYSSLCRCISLVYVQLVYGEVYPLPLYTMALPPSFLLHPRTSMLSSTPRPLRVLIYSMSITTASSSKPFPASSSPPPWSSTLYAIQWSQLPSSARGSSKTTLSKQFRHSAELGGIWLL